MAVLTTPRLHLPYPDGNDRLRDGDNRIGDLAIALDDLSKTGIPFAMAAGVAVITAPGGTTSPGLAVGFPAGRFTVMPVVITQVAGTITYLSSVFGTTAAGTTVTVFHSTAGANVPAGTYNVFWHAVQMLGGSGPG